MMEAEQPWGTFPPTSWERLLLFAKSCGLGLGRGKRMLHCLWMRSRGEHPVDVCYNGIKLRLYPGQSTLDSKMLTSSRLREKEELLALKAALAQGGNFLDLGANSGYYSLMAANYGVERVFAVEANPAMCERLRFNADANGFSDRVEVLQVALGERDGTTELLLLGGDTGSNRIARADELGERITVPMRSLLSLLNELEVKCLSALKIDVEGMEDAVLLPFFSEAPMEKWPRFVIMEYAQQASWKGDALSRMKVIGYDGIGRTRSNEMLRLRASKEGVS